MRSITILLIILIIVSALSIQRINSTPQGKGRGLKIISIGNFTVEFPANGSKPMFIWWYNGDNKTKYIVDFKGLWEYFLINNTVEFHRRNAATRENLNKTLLPFLRGIVHRIEVLNRTASKLGIADNNLTSLINYIYNINNEILQANETNEEIRKNLANLKNEMNESLVELNEINKLAKQYNSSLTKFPFNKAVMNKFSKQNRELYSKLLEAMKSNNAAKIFKTLNSTVGQWNNSFEGWKKEHKKAKIFGILNNILNKIEERRNSVISRIKRINELRSKIGMLKRNTAIKFKSLMPLIMRGKLKAKNITNIFKNMTGSPKINEITKELNNVSSLISKLPLLKLNETIGKEEFKKNFNAAHNMLKSILNKTKSIKGTIKEIKMKILKEASEIRQKSIEVKRGVLSVHSPYFSFHSAVWNVSNIIPIKTNNGKKIGMSFEFKLVKSNEPGFIFAENNIVIVCRLYSVPVVENVSGVLYNLTRNEMKIDFRILKWNWTVNPFRKYNCSIGEGLALWINIASVNSTGKFARVNVTARSKNFLKVINIFKNNTKGYEKLLKIPGKFMRIDMTSKSGLVGFFKFVNTALVTYPNGTTKEVSVSASYLENGGMLMLYIGYPYFDGGSLDHDPSIGVLVRQNISAPLYTVKISSTSTNIAPSNVSKVIASTSIVPKQGTAKIFKLLIMESLPIIVIALIVTLISALAVLILRRKKIINSFG